MLTPTSIVSRLSHRGLPYAALAMLAAGLSFWYGRLGFMPLDNSIVFDGAWRLYQGQIPFRDFVIPNGLVPMAMQAGVFAMAGVSWLAYVAHAAVINAAGAVVVFSTLASTGLPRSIAWLYGAVAALVLYPPVGTPYMDQHAFFFLLVTVRVVALVILEGDLRWVPAIGPLLVLAALSKQVGALAACALAILPLVILGREKLGQYLGRLVAGGVLAVAAVFLTGVTLGIDWSMAWQFGFTLPSAVGAERWEVIRGEPLLHHIRALPSIFGWDSFSRRWTIGMGVVLAATVIATVVMRSLDARIRLYALALLGAFGFVATYVILRLTNNDMANGAALLPLVSGFTHATLHDLLRQRASATGSPRWGAAAGLAVVSVAGVALLSANIWHSAVRTRAVNDLTFVRDHTCGAWPDALRGLEWSVPRRYGTTCAQFSALYSHLSDRRQPFFVMGDTTVLYAALGTINPSPSVFFHRGLTFPEDPEAQRTFEDWLLRNLDREEVRQLVVEHPATWMGVSLADFPGVAAVVASSTCARTTFGKYEVIELCEVPRWHSPERAGGTE